MRLTGDIRPVRAFAIAAFHEDCTLSYSQFGEDIAIQTFFHSKTAPGFYVDVGAHHPTRFSNTHLLYLRGWRGINIDADADLLAAFEAERTGDVNVAAVISDREEVREFRKFTERAVNTIDDGKAQEFARHWSISSTVVVNTRRLRDILAA